MGSVVLAIDGGTESLRVGLICADSGALIASHAAAYPTHTPHNGWAEQSPEDWWAALATATRGCLEGARAAGVEAERVVALSFVTTTCTLLPLAADGTPLCPALLWSDVRAGAQADRIFATQHAAVQRVSSAGFSAEWMLAKALWLHDERPELYASTARFVEYGDWLLERLTGTVALSANTAAHRWLYDNRTETSEADRWPLELFESLGLATLHEKLPPVLQVGDDAAPGLGLSAEAAAALGGLPAGIPVFVGGGDAFVGLLGMGVSAAGEFGLMTGSSAVLCGLTEPLPVDTRGSGLFGAFYNSVVPGVGLLEAGQPATGSMLRWFQQELGGGRSLQELDAEAAAVQPGSGGVICFDGFQGNRTPHTDSRARGAVWGLSLGTSRAHMYRAMLEGSAFGTRAMLQAVLSVGAQEESPHSHTQGESKGETQGESKGASPSLSRLTVVGGATRSPIFMQLLADVRPTAPSPTHPSIED